MTAPALRSLAYWAYQYRRTWRGTVVTGLLTPLLYLTAMGVGLGSLVNHHGRFAGVGYLPFIAPGLLAATAMQTATGEGTWPVMDAFTWRRGYHAMAATPLGTTDVLVGHLLWIAARVLMVSTVFFAVMAGFGVLHSWAAVFAVPAALLTGLAFASPIVAFAATQRRDVGFAALYRFGVIPLFLFSGTFFPISQLPGWLRPVAYATPLWHGVSLCRSLTLGGAATPATAGHVGYLAALAVVGTLLARMAYRRRLAG